MLWVLEILWAFFFLKVVTGNDGEKVKLYTFVCFPCCFLIFHTSLTFTEYTTEKVGFLQGSGELWVMLYKRTYKLQSCVYLHINSLVYCITKPLYEHLLCIHAYTYKMCLY